MNSVCFQRKIFLGVAGVSLTCVGAAVTLQVAESLTPCPLCIVQRLCFLVLAAACLARVESQKVTPLRWATSFLALAAGLTCMAVAAQHYYEQTHPIEFSTCAPGFETWWNNLWPAKLLPVVFQATGQCMLVDVTLLGLPLPVWSFLASLVCVAAVATAMWRRHRC